MAVVGAGDVAVPRAGRPKRAATTRVTSTWDAQQATEGAESSGMNKELLLVVLVCVQYVRKRESGLSSDAKNNDLHM